LQQDGSIGERLSRVEVGAQIFEPLANLDQLVAVALSHGDGVSGTGPHELAVHLCGKSSKPRGRFSSAANAREVVQRIGCTH